MIREFVDLVNEAVNSGYDKGIKLFVENLEEDLKNYNESETEVDDKIKNLFINEGYELDEEIEQLDEDLIDQALENIE